jgi:hypothetical protein
MATLQMFSPRGFRFTCEFLPNISDWVQRVDIPSLAVGTTKEPTPFSFINVGGDYLNYSDLKITFKLDEDLTNYYEVVKWLKAKAPGTSHETYQTWVAEYGNIKTDATLLFLSAKFGKVIGKWDFHDIMPNEISGFTMHSDEEGLEYVTVEASFDFTKAEFTKL